MAPRASWIQLSRVRRSPSKLILRRQAFWLSATTRKSMRW